MTRGLSAVTPGAPGAAKGAAPNGVAAAQNPPVPAVCPPHFVPPAGPPVPFAFVGREDVKRPLQRFGSDVVRFAHYKVHVDGDDHWFTVLLSSDGRIAGYEAY